mmetsp:Transcript_1845/g.5111  ORF Transcript_1845/g.5111 Transcript_1845/m.5111 type:complete len:275 (-) Transcript_1845:243-1067(-)|eukprot:CAMPEP_0119139098 /NCGR_PEP_ID=MMETSP1310-20130426/26882_1 /TAXON_ID=464262 /ORGANISM="Genus nov. species nov., Strain RCC2339" /LENGTH=274 /DNA_ID=CAMNT_0007130357 /DNA_START=60 /DNA_END=884 /DNA_ORIENTATION=-
MRVVYAIVGVVVLLESVMGQMTQTCSSSAVHFPEVNAKTECEGFQQGTYAYPSDFRILNDVAWYVCPDSGKRIVQSNGIPDHNVTVGNPNDSCVTPWHVEMPLLPKLSNTLTEPSSGGIIAVHVNGVPFFGAQEADGLNAVQPGDGPVQDAQYWWGHAEMFNHHHYHNPFGGFSERPSNETLVGYALDGVPLYGPVDDSSVLDACNGRVNNAGEYVYHVIPVDKVDGLGSYCDGDSPAILWNYIIGCYHATLAHTVVTSSETTALPSDCVRVAL